ncbi:MAG: FdhD protein [Cryomorphaceae bacterium]
MSVNSSKPKTQRRGVLQRTVQEQTSDEAGSEKLDQIAEEVPVAFAYNGQSHAVMMASPLDLNDYAVGFSLTERIIDNVDDILNIEVLEAKQGFTVQLHIKPHLVERLDKQRRQLSGRSGCGICGISDLAAAIPQLEPVTKTTKPSHAIIAAALEEFQSKQSMQQECGAVHCAALFNAQGVLLELKEDIGRHNALDKVIGARTKVSAIKVSDFVVMSSRASHELITKTVIAGAGTIVAVSAATSLAIDIAEQLNLNLVGFVRGERQVVYHQN